LDRLPLSIAMGRGPGGGASAGGFRTMTQQWKPAAEKVVTLDALLAALGSRRAAGERVAFTNGTFDLVHVGHLRSLEQARAQGDLLVVGINSDASVRSYKEPGRPIVPQAERAELIAGLACVAYVVIFDEPTAVGLLQAIQPEVYVKGADYATKPLPERPIVEAYGGRIVLVELEAGRSTSVLIARIVETFGGPSDARAG
jgi:rfaE bifunctional protein nucleotidyltransferase chain/domain